MSNKISFIDIAKIHFCPLFDHIYVSKSLNIFILIEANVNHKNSFDICEIENTHKTKVVNSIFKASHQDIIDCEPVERPARQVEFQLEFFQFFGNMIPTYASSLQISQSFYTN